MITHQNLLSVTRYDPDTGLFIALTQRGSLPYGAIMGSVGNHGYIQFQLEKRMYLAHRVAFFYMTQRWPQLIDHINGRKTDNRWANLREASAVENARNRSAMSNSKSGLKGVSWCSRKRKWQAFIKGDEKQHFLGYFETPELAHAAYAEVAPRVHREFART